MNVKLKKILEICNEISHFELQESWDNSGLQIGNLQEEIENIVVSLEIDASLIETIPANSVVITHHPLIFDGLKQLDFNTYPAKFIQKMIQKNISAIALHTNFDQTHLNDYVAKEVLGFEIAEKDGFVAYVDVDMKFDALCDLVAKSFDLKHQKIVKAKERIKRLALCTGSGASMLDEVKADCYLTGDIKYHDAMLAKALGTAMIEIGHYESERFFSDILAKELKNFGLQAIIAHSQNPFDYN